MTMSHVLLCPNIIKILMEQNKIFFVHTFIIFCVYKFILYHCSNERIEIFDIFIKL